MNRFPGLEAAILRTLEEEGEMRPPQGRLAQEFFWQKASELQSRGMCVADQRAGVVRAIPRERGPDVQQIPFPDRGESFPTEGRHLRRIRAEMDYLVEHGVIHAYPALSLPAPATDLPARLRLLLRRWRVQDEVRGGAEGSVFGQCANDLQEVMEECGVPL